MPFDISRYAAEHAVPMERTIETVTEEILRLKSDAGNAIIGIGQRLTEAKEMLPHGEWLPWLTERVDFSERTAQNFMRLAREWSNPQALADLGATKALTLLALPEAERDAFIAETHEVAGEEKTVAEMTSRELAEAIRERDEARLAREAAEADARVAEEARARMEADMAALKAFNESSMAAQAEARKALAKAEAELRELKSRPVEVAVQVDEKAVEKARKDAIAEMQAKVDKARADAKKADAQRKEAEEDLAAVRTKLADAKKNSAGAAAISGDKDLTVFEVYFAQAQEAVNKMHGILLKVRGKDAEKAAKLQQALAALADMVRGCAQ